MTNQMIIALWPWMLLLACSVFIARVLVRLSNARLNVRRVVQVHRCQEGSVQSLSFVLTLPFFLMVLMLIIQVSQIMIANVVVNYAAINTVRSASVWIPANMALDETANRISTISVIQSTQEGTQFQITADPQSPKYSKIRQAAVLACSPLAPSRDLGYSLDTNGQLSALALTRLYRGLDADSVANTLIPTRIENKFAFSDANTDVQIRFWHRVGPFENFRDPPLQRTYGVGPYFDEYYPNEVGWQDELTTIVTHRLALLPGPIRLFSSNVEIDETGNAYTFPVAAAATMVIEGDKPLLPHWQREAQ